MFSFGLTLAPLVVIRRLLYLTPVRHRGDVSGINCFSWCIRDINLLKMNVIYINVMYRFASCHIKETIPESCSVKLFLLMRSPNCSERCIFRRCITGRKTFSFTFFQHLSCTRREFTGSRNYGRIYIFFFHNVFCKTELRV